MFFKKKKSPTIEGMPERRNLNQLSQQLPGYSYGPRPQIGIQGSSTRMNMQPIPPPEKPPRRKRHLWKKFFILLLLALLIWGGWLGWKFLSNEIKVFGWGGLWSALHPAKLNGEDSGHVNVLLAGNSADDPGHGGANLTDSIMLVSVNTQTKQSAFMLSVPRDLYVDIPGHGYGKINEVFQDGEQDNFSEAGYARGGMGLLEKVVSQKFNVPIHYYALVNYGAVRDAVNAVGGINLNIQSTDPRGLYDPSPDLSNNFQPLVNLSNGPHNLNGTEALGLARSRGDAYGAYGFPLSDFDRTQHQRQIFLALRDKATSVGTLANPLKVGQLFDSVGKNVKTDLSLGNLRRLNTLTKNIPSDKITSAGLNSVNGESLLASYRTPYGQSTLIPKAGRDNYSTIQAYIQQLLST